MKKVAWWFVRLTCGAAAVLGTLLVAMGSMELFFLFTGRVEPNLENPGLFESPGISAVLSYSITGLVMMVSGYKLPGWLNWDRLL